MLRSLLTGLLAALMMLAPPAMAQVGANVEAPAAGSATYLNSANLRDRAFAALLKKIGPAPQVSRIEITDGTITAWVQGRAAHHTDEWRIERQKLLVFDRDAITGPRAVPGDGIVARQEGSFFAFADVGFDQLEQAVTAAISMAQMERLPTVGSVTIARRIAILPEPHYGEVRWTIALGNERETASVYADIGGRVYGADLSGTTRAKRLDLIADDDWPMDEAQADIAAALAGRPLKELRVYDTYLYFTADTDTNTTRDYSWKLGGVRLGLEMPAFPSFGDTMPFAVSEFDLTRLPEVKRKALAAYDWPDARIGYIYAEKSTERAAAPQLLWRVDIKQANGEDGYVLVDAAANVVEMVLPESRAIAAAGPWLAPETVAGTLARLGKEFGPQARFGEILINDTQGAVLVEDPQARGQMASFIIDPRRITRFGTPMPWEAEANPDKLFTLEQLAPLDAATLARLAGQAVETMNLPGAAVFRYTFSRGTMIMDPSDNRLLVEIRVGKDDGWTSGWVTYEIDGRVADTMLP